MTKKIISPIAIDLGAKNTGVFLSQYFEGEALQSHHSKAVTLVLPENASKMTYSQQARTATRHRIRTNKRRKLAKRLLKLAVFKLMEKGDIQLTGVEWDKSWEALCGLMNRRGYNRINTELDEGALISCDPRWFHEQLGDYFTNLETPLLEQWQRIIQRKEQIRDLYETDIFELSKKDFKKRLKTDGIEDKDEQEAVTLAWESMKIELINMISELDFGHRHRKEYLEIIYRELEKDSRLSPLVNTCGIENLWRVIGNISNLQLRTSRWYFNDAKMKEGDYWDGQKLHEVLIRWFRFWRPQSTVEKRSQKEALDLLKSHSDVLDVLSKIDPKLTIPPYEDQDNRRPPKDQTLWLNPQALETQYGNVWQIWGQKLLLKHPELSEGLIEILALFDRKSRLKSESFNLYDKNNPDLHNQPLALSYVLQRLLDRNQQLDKYRLRYLCKSQNNHNARKALENLSNVLGTQHLDKFLHFCQKYYHEVTLAKQGLWTISNDNLLERADINPPHKKKILAILVSNTLGENWDNEKLQDFKSNLWSKTVSGRSTLKSLCAAIEKCRKEHGNLFNEKLKRLRYRVEHLRENPKQLKGDEKILWSIWEKTMLVANTISDYLEHTTEKKSKYENPFSLSQLYNLLETDRNGFSKISLAAHIENTWRMGQVMLEGKKIARSSRLPADSIRPFDGVLRRALDRQAYEIAKLKAEQIQTISDKNTNIIVPLLIEENRFTFNLGLGELKKNKKKKDEITKKLNQQTERWDEKLSRIQKASKGICPYNGKEIGDHGEIDHILPRSESKSKDGTTFNSEANLIWCSRAGNLQKSEKRYLIENLNSKYLIVQFGTSNTHEIIDIINKTVASLGEDFIFDSLTEQEQRDVRHALFLPIESQAFKKVSWRLASQLSMRVNGTQGWLLREIMRSLSLQLKPWLQNTGNALSFCAQRISAEQVHSVRRRLSEENIHFEKKEIQSTISHVIDAMCVLASASAAPKLESQLCLGSSLVEDMAWLSSCMPNQADILHIQNLPIYRKDDISSQQLFKENPLSENFHSIWVNNKGVKIGFDPYNAESHVTVEGSDPYQLIQSLEAFLCDHIDLEKSIKSEKYIRIKIDKNKTFSFFDQIAKHPHTTEDDQLARLLESLTYITQNKEIWSHIYDAAKKSFKSRNDIFKKDLFFTKVTLQEGRGRNVIFSCKGNIQLPSFHDWQRLLNNDQISALIGKKNKLPEDTRGISQSFFNSGSKRPHGKSRRIYSLPILTKSSGGFRFRRKAPEGKTHWQRHDIEGSAVSGFIVDDDHINWKQCALLEPIAKSQRVTEANARYVSINNSVRLDHWLAIPMQQLQEPPLQLYLSPATKGRFYIRIVQNFDQFKNWLNGAVDQIPSSYFDLNNTLKLKDTKRFADNHNLTLLGKPRKTLFIETIGVSVCYRYEVDSTNAEMRNAYQEAYSSLINS